MKEISLKGLTGGSDITKPELSVKFVASCIILFGVFVLAKPVGEYIAGKFKNTVAPAVGKVSAIVD